MQQPQLALMSLTNFHVNIDMSKRNKRQSHYSQAHIEPPPEPNAAERVFSYPYLARDIVKWAGLSAKTLRAVHPSVSRLERNDPKFKLENEAMLPQITMLSNEITVYYKSLGRTEELFILDGFDPDLSMLKIIVHKFGNTAWYKSNATIIYEGDTYLRKEEADGGGSLIVNGLTSSHSTEEFIPENQPLNPALWQSLIETYKAARQ